VHEGSPGTCPGGIPAWRAQGQLLLEHRQVRREDLATYPDRAAKFFLGQVGGVLQHRVDRVRMQPDLAQAGVALGDRFLAPPGGDAVHRARWRVAFTLGTHHP